MRGVKRERILRVLLSEPVLSKNKLAQLADCTRQWVILFLKELEKRRLVKGTKVLSPQKLIDYWLSIHKKPKKYREYLLKEPEAILKKNELPYAITTYVAENLVQHHLFPSRYDLYIREEDLQKWHSLLTKNGLYGKGNVRIIITEEHTAYKKRKLNNLWIVCLPQLIIDLLIEGGPCEEAAEMLLKMLEKNVSRI